jgi:hypothetical protein
MSYDDNYGYDNAEGTEEEFTDIDDLIEQWDQFLHREMQPFKVIRSDLFGTGCVCDLKTMFLQNDFSPEYVMSLIPRVKDCYSNCLSMEYNKYLTMFLSSFLNMSGAPMNISDLGQDEVFFYNKFVEVVESKAIFNSWDLWSTKNRAGN